MYGKCTPRACCLSVKLPDILKKAVMQWVFSTEFSAPTVRRSLRKSNRSRKRYLSWMKNIRDSLMQS